MKLTHCEVLKEVRKAAKDVGLVFKRDRFATINGYTAYQFRERESGLLVGCNYTLASAYEDCCSGYISSYDLKSGFFEGVMI